MSNIVRYYFELNPIVVDRYGGYQYLTAEVNELIDGWLPRIAGYGPYSFNQLLGNSDKVIQCDSTSTRYIKHREMNPEEKVVDSIEFFEIKLKSVEIG